MKKTVIFLLSAVFMLTLFSCGSDKPAENLADLQKKYKDKEFKNCDEFIVAYEEAMDIYFALLDKDAKGDETVLKDIEGFDAFLTNWAKDAEKFEKECPEKMEKLDESIDKRMDAYFDELFGDDFEDEDVELTDEEWAEIGEKAEAELELLGEE